MSYRDNIQREHEQSAKEQAARNIHERLEKITLMGAAEAARRWFWELLQNARDVALNDAGIRARVHLQANEETVLQFSHDGGPFTSGDLVRLIEQDSNKRKEIPEDRPRPIGRFGTGFLTTHLLARVVDVEGIAHDPGEQSKHFHLPLDRSGSTIDDLQRGVEATFEALSTLDEQPPIANYLSGKQLRESNAVFRTNPNQDLVKGLFELL